MANNSILYFASDTIGSGRGKNISESLNAIYITTVSKTPTNVLIKILYIFHFFVDLFRIAGNLANTIIFELGGHSYYFLLLIKIVSLLPKTNYALDVHTCVYVENNQPVKFNKFLNKIFHKAKIVILHNEQSLELLEIPGQKLVLESKIPVINNVFQKDEATVKKIVFITRFHDDEPIAEMIDASSCFEADYQFYFTGNYKKAGFSPEDFNDNIHFTGFLPDELYLNLLINANLIIVLTTRPYTLVYGGREGLALTKPMIISDNNSNRVYFNKGVYFCDNSSSELKRLIPIVLNNEEKIVRELKELKREKELLWNERLLILNDKLSS